MQPLSLHLPPFALDSWDVQAFSFYSLSLTQLPQPDIGPERKNRMEKRQMWSTSIDEQKNAEITAAPGVVPTTAHHAYEKNINMNLTT